MAWEEAGCNFKVLPLVIYSIKRGDNSDSVVSVFGHFFETFPVSKVSSSVIGVQRLTGALLYPQCNLAIE